jgi:signal transduction histidine kinase
VLRDRQAIYAEGVTVLDENGRKNDLIVNAVPIMREGKLVSAVAVYQDVTELRDLESVLQGNLRETTTLYEISRAISLENDLNGILSVVGNQLYYTINPDYTYAIFNAAQDESLQIYAVRFEEEGVFATTALTRLPIPSETLIPDQNFVDSNITENPNFADDTMLRTLGIQSLNVFPLLARGRTIGWLVVAFKTQRMFSTEERRTLSNIADQTAVAVESARLAEQTALALSTATLLYEASLNINSADSLDATLEAMRDQIIYFEPDQVDIFLLETKGEDRFVKWVVHSRPHSGDDTPDINTESPIYVDNGNFLEFEPYYINSIADADPRYSQQIESLPSSQAWGRQTDWWQFEAQASLPMTLKGRVIGRIIASFNKLYHFGRTEQQVLSTLADQGAIAIDNFTLVQQTQESLDETSMLYHASRSITNAVTLEEQLSAVVDYAMQYVASVAMLVRLNVENWDAPEATVEIVAHWRSDENMPDITGVRFTPDQFPVWQRLASQEQLWVEDVANIPDISDEENSFFYGFGFRALIVFPLQAGGVPIGAMLFGSEEIWPYNDREERIYRSLADLIATSIDRQRLLDEAEDRARELKLSADIAQATASILDLGKLFNSTVNMIKDNFNYDHVQIFLLSEDERDAKVVASTGETGKALIDIGHKLAVGSRSVIGQVTSTGLPQIVSDTTDQRTVHRPNPYLPNTRAEMAVPMISRNRIMGALDVQSNEPGRFTRNDVTVISSLADQIAIAIDNAGLYNEADRRAREMQFLFDTANVATQIITDEQRAFQNIAQLVLENLKGDAVSVLIADDMERRMVAYSAQLPTSKIILPSGDTLNLPTVASLLQEKESVVINDLAAIHQLAESSKNASKYAPAGPLLNLVAGAQSLMLVPISAGEILVGAILLVDADANAFDDEALKLTKTLASTLAALIQNARLLQEVQQANTRLLELDKLKNQFLANMSHELRTPLNSIIGFSRVILKGIDGPLTEMQKQDLTTIYESGRHLLGLVNDILDQAKIEADKIDFTFAQFSAIDMIKGVMSTAVGLVREKPIRLYQELDADLPPAWGDEFRTRQALLNLVSNAAKFTEQGSITATAKLTTVADQQMIEISVTDTGLGIPENKIDAIFEPFQQADNTAARQYEGTGLGLPIARKLIEKQGGRLWGKSQIGVGSTFYLTIPINPPADYVPEEA